MRILAAAMIMGMLALAARTAQAALPPEAYEDLRQTAPLAFVGTVQNDPGGQASVRVDHVARGLLGIGQFVTVIYPVDRGGQGMPGAEVLYRPFVPGTRLRVFGQLGYDGRTVQIVAGGIDVMTPPPPARGGCASCTAGGGDSTAAPLFALLGLGLWALRRRQRGLALSTALVLVACSPAGPVVPPPLPTGTPTATGDDGKEVASDGKSSVTVLSRPDHPSVKPPPGHVPGPRTTAECRAAQTCATQGLCTASGTTCVAASYADCEQMRGCGLGKCAFAAGVCSVVATCKASDGCTREGSCVDKGDGCVADADGCSQSTRCSEEGRCSIDDGLCVAAADSDCKDAKACTHGGRCKADAGSCIVKSDQECKVAAVCKEEERCSARDGICVKSCAEDELCKKHGRCGERDSHPGSCVALSDADCDKAEVCADLGHCSLGLDARCEAGDDVECRLSRACKEDGRCTQKRGRCLPASDAECSAATIACKREGRCKHQAGRCVKG